MSFLPDDYQPEEEKQGLYFKPTKPKTSASAMHRVRLLSAPILYMELFKNNKPIRYKMGSPCPVIPDVGQGKDPKRVFSFIIWNYDLKKIMIWGVTQKLIHKFLEELAANKDTADPSLYDIQIIRTGEGNESRYACANFSPSPLEDSIRSAFYSLPLDLNELLTAGKPEITTPQHRTRALWEREQPSIQTSEECISTDQAGIIENEINMWINKGDPDWKKRVLDALKIPHFKALPKRRFDDLWGKLQTKKASLNPPIDDEIPF